MVTRRALRPAVYAVVVALVAALLAAAVPAGPAAALGATTLTASVTSGTSPLAVRFTTTIANPALSWSLTFSDGSPAASGSGAPPATIDRTLVNDGALPVVVTATLRVLHSGFTSTTANAVVTVNPSRSTGARVAVTPTPTTFRRGQTGSVQLRVVNTTNITLLGGFSVVYSGAGLATSATGTGWTCTTSKTVTCSIPGTFAPGAAASPITVVVPIGAAATDPYSASVQVTAPGAKTSTTAVSVPVDGFVAEAGPAQTVPMLTPGRDGALAATTITLDASATTSAGRPQTFTWTRVSGPTIGALTAVEPSGRRVTLAAPVVATTQVLRMQVSATDGVTTAADTVDITITPVNRPPAITNVTSSPAITPGADGAFVPTAAGPIRFTPTITDADGTTATVTWTPVGALPAGALTQSGSVGVLQWPVAGLTQVPLQVTATDPAGATTTRLVVVGTLPLPLSLTGPSAPMLVTGAQPVTITVTPSELATVTWTRLSGPDIGVLASGTTLTFTAPNLTSLDSIVLRATATTSDGRTAFVDVSVLVSPPIPVTITLAPTASVALGATYKPAPTVTGTTTGVKYAWTQTFGPAVTITNATKLRPTITAPNVDTAIGLRLTARVPGQPQVRVDQTVTVGSPTTPTGTGCDAGSPLSLVRGGATSLDLGATVLTLGFVTVPSAPCEPGESISFLGGGFALFDGAISGSDLVGTVTGTGVCITAGTVRANPGFKLGEAAIAPGEPLCVDLVASPPAAPALTLEAADPQAVAAATATPPCTVPIQGTIDWPGRFPMLKLPAGLTATGASLTLGCNDATITATAAATGGGTLTASVTIGLDGTGTGSFQLTNLPLLGGTASASGTATVTPGGVSDPKITGTIANPQLGVPGLTVGQVTFTLSSTGLSASADGVVGSGGSALSVHVEGAFTSVTDYSLKVTARVGSWTPTPGLTISGASLVGTLASVGGAVSFRIDAGVSGSWTPVPQVTVTSIGVSLSNTALPAECTGIPSGSLWIRATGTASVTVPGAPAIGLNVDACLSVPGTGSPSFLLRSTATFPRWKPIPSIDAYLEQVSISVTSTPTGLTFEARGDGRVLGIATSGRLLARSGGAGSGVALIVSGDVSSLAIPGFGTGHVVATSAPMSAITLQPGLTVDAPAGITAFGSVAIPADSANFLNQTLKPAQPIGASIVMSASISSNGIVLTGSIELGPSGIELFATCPARDTNPNAACSPTDANTTRVALNRAFIRLTAGSSGLQLGFGGEGTLKLPPSQAGGVSPIITIGAEAFIRPPAEIGLSLYLTSPTGVPNILGITGLTLNSMVIQGSVDFTVPTAPVPSMGALLEVAPQPTFALNRVLGLTGNGEPFRIAANISPKAPVFELAVGVDSPDGPTGIVMRPLAPLDGTATGLDAQLEVDFASVVFAPLGGKIGPFTYSPGVSARFGAVIAGVPVEVNATIDIAALTIAATAKVGTFTVAGITMDSTVLSIDIRPIGFAFTFSGGVSVNGGPRLTGSFDFRAGLSFPGSGGAAPAVGLGIGLRVDLGVASWTVVPGTTISAVKVSAAATLNALTGDVNTTITFSGSATIMGFTSALSGVVVLDGVTLRELHIRGASGTISVGGVQITGSGSCQASIVEGATVTAPPLPPSATGPCFQVDYVSKAVVPLGAGFAGKLLASGMTATVKATVDSLKATMTGTLTVPTVGNATVSGVLFHGTTLTSQRIRNEAGTLVVPAQGDWRIDGSLTASLGGTSTAWSFNAGRVAANTWVRANGNVNVFGAVVKIDGRIASTGGDLTYDIRGTSSARTDTGEVWVINPGDPRNPLDPGNAVHATVQAAVDAKLLIFGGRPRDAGAFEPVRGRLRGNASYTFQVRLSNSTGFSVAADGTATVKYTEAFDPDGNNVFVEESSTRWTTLVDVTLSFDSGSGRFCYRWDQFMVGDCSA